MARKKSKNVVKVSKKEKFQNLVQTLNDAAFEAHDILHAIDTLEEQEDDTCVLKSLLCERLSIISEGVDLLKGFKVK